MAWEGINKRKFPRISYKCRIKVSKDGKEEVIDTFTENIGAGGICVVLEKGFGLFDNVSLEMYLGEDENPILCNGIIVWVVKEHPVDERENARYDTGIEFRDIQDEDRQRIDALVQSILHA